MWNSSGRGRATPSRLGCSTCRESTWMPWDQSCRWRACRACCRRRPDWSRYPKASWWDRTQIPVPLANLTTVQLVFRDRAVSVVSFYVEGGNDEALNMATLETDRPIRRFRNGTGIRTDATLTGDFHWHDQLWGVTSSGETTCWGTHILLPSTHHHMNSLPFSSCLSKTSPHRRDKAEQTAISKEYLRP